MWAAASQVRDRLLLITSPFADLTCFWNLLWTIYQRFSTKDFKLTQALLDYYWSRLLQEYDPELNERMMWQKSKWAGRKSHCVGLTDFTPRGICALGKIVKAHRGSDGTVKSFDIQTATGIIQRPAVTLNRVFPRLSCAPEIKSSHWNEFNETHAYKELIIWMKTIVLYFIVFTFSSQVLSFRCCECKGTQCLENFSPLTPNFLPPHIHFHPSKTSHPSTYLHWCSLYVVVFLTMSAVVDIRFHFFYGKEFAVFFNNLCANGANNYAYIELALLPWIRISEMQLLMINCISMQDTGQREPTQVELDRCQRF